MFKHKGIQNKNQSQQVNKVRKSKGRIEHSKTQPRPRKQETDKDSFGGFVSVQVCFVISLLLL